MLLRANVGGDGVILRDGTLFFKVTPTQEERIMGNEEQRPSVSVTAGIGTLSVRSSNRHGTRGTSTQQAFPVEAVGGLSPCFRSWGGVLVPHMGGVDA